MDPLFREAKKRWIAEQSAEWRRAYYDRASELKDGKAHYLEREEALNEEFEIDRDRLTDQIEEVRLEWSEKKAATKEAKKAKRSSGSDSLPPTEPPREVEPPPRGSLIASNDVSNVKWVAENLPNDDAQREDAPSVAAWGMLCWARRNPDQFYTQIYKQVVIPTKREIEEASDAADDEDRLIDALDRVRKIAGDLIDA